MNYVLKNWNYDPTLDQMKIRKNKKDQYANEYVYNIITGYNLVRFVSKKYQE